MWWWVHAPIPASPGWGRVCKACGERWEVVVVVVVEWALASYMWWGHTQA